MHVLRAHSAAWQHDTFFPTRNLGGVGEEDWTEMYGAEFVTAALKVATLGSDRLPQELNASAVLAEDFYRTDLFAGTFQGRETLLSTERVTAPVAMLSPVKSSTKALETVDGVEISIDKSKGVKPGSVGMSFEAVPGRGMKVTKIVPGVSADVAGQESGYEFAAGMYITAISGHDVRDLNKKEVGNIVRGAGTIFTMNLNGVPKAGGPVAQSRSTMLVVVDKMQGGQPGSTGLAFDMVPGRGCKIARVSPGAAADVTGKFKAGMYIVAVNGEDVRDGSKQETVGLIRGAGDSVTFMLEYEIKVPKPAPPKHVAVPRQQLEHVVLTTTNSQLTVTVDKTKGLQPGSIGLNFEYVAGDGSKITAVRPGAAADVTGMIKAGMYIVAVNGEDVRNSPKQETSTLIRGTGDTVVFTLQRKPEVPVPSRLDFAPTTDSQLMVTVDKTKGLQPGSTGLNFEYVAGDGSKITAVRPGAAADVTGMIKAGMYIVAVNGEDVRNSPKQDTSTLIRGAGDTVVFTLQRKPEVPEKSVKSTEKRITVEVDKTKGSHPGSIGLQMDFVSGKGCNIGKVMPGGAADVSGIKAGMRIVALNGKDVRNVPKEDTSRLIRGAGDVITLTLERDGAAASAPRPDPPSMDKLPHAGKGSATPGRAPEPESEPNPMPAKPTQVEMHDIADFKTSDLGRRVVVAATFRATGKLSFVGMHHEHKKGTRLGVTLDNSEHGKNDGSIDDGKHRYFSCDDGYGLVLSTKYVTFDDDDELDDDSDDDIGSGGAVGPTRAGEALQVHPSPPQEPIRADAPAPAPVSIIKAATVRDLLLRVFMGLNKGSHDTKLVDGELDHELVSAAALDAKLPGLTALLDANGDGNLTAEDIRSHLDTNGDGSISITEFTRNLMTVINAQADGGAAAAGGAVSASERPESKAPAPKKPAFTTHKVIVDKTKGNKPGSIGLSFAPVPGKGCMIARVTPGAAAAVTGEIKVGMLIVEVNGHSVRDLPKAETGGLIRSAGDIVQLTLVGAQERAGSDSGAAAPPEMAKVKWAKGDVVLDKTKGVQPGSTGLKFDHVPGKGCKIVAMTPGAAADVTGKVKVGMYIVAVNGIDVRNLPKPETGGLIRGAGDVVTLRLKGQVGGKGNARKRPGPIKPASLLEVASADLGSIKPRNARKPPRAQKVKSASSFEVASVDLRSAKTREKEHPMVSLNRQSASLLS